MALRHKSGNFGAQYYACIELHFSNVLKMVPVSKVHYFNEKWPAATTAEFYPLFTHFFVKSEKIDVFHPKRATFIELREVHYKGHNINLLHRMSHGISFVVT